MQTLDKSEALSFLAIADHGKNPAEHTWRRGSSHTDGSSGSSRGPGACKQKSSTQIKTNMNTCLPRYCASAWHWVTEGRGTLSEAQDMTMVGPAMKVLRCFPSLLSCQISAVPDLRCIVTRRLVETVGRVFDPAVNSATVVFEHDLWSDT